jgi:hypothetical protein
MILRARADVRRPSSPIAAFSWRSVPGRSSIFFSFMAGGLSPDAAFSLMVVVVVLTG